MTHSSSSFRLRPLSVAILTALFHNAAYAAPVSWVPDADGFWDVVTNWSSNPALPLSVDDVTINVGGAAVRTVTHRSGTNTVNSLASQENFVLGLPVFVWVLFEDEAAGSPIKRAIAGVAGS